MEQRECWLCEAEMTKFENQVVMFDEVPVVCSGWVCKCCGDIVLDLKEVDKVLKKLKEIRAEIYD